MFWRQLSSPANTVSPAPTIKPAPVHSDSDGDGASFDCTESLESIH